MPSSRFDSILVRLKESLMKAAPEMYKGFDSILVRLKAWNAIGSLIQFLNSFDSILVRLKEQQ